MLDEQPNSWLQRWTSQLRDRYLNWQLNEQTKGWMNWQTNSSFSWKDLESFNYFFLMRENQIYHFSKLRSGKNYSSQVGTFFWQSRNLERHRHFRTASGRRRFADKRPDSSTRSRNLGASRRNRRRGKCSRRRISEFRRFQLKIKKKSKKEIK